MQSAALEGFGSLSLLARVANLMDESLVVTTANHDQRGYRIVFVNQAFCAMTGYEPGEVIGRTPALLQGPRTDHAVLAEVRAALIQGRDFDGRAINYRKNGEAFEIEWHIRAVRNLTGVVTHFFAVQRDVSREAELEARLERLRRAIEQIADPVVIFDPQGRVLDANPALTSWTSEPLEHSRGKPVWRLPGAPRNIRDFNWARHLLSRRRAWVRQYPSRLCLNGGWQRRLVQAHVTPLLNRSGGVIGFVAVAQDVTEKVRLEQIAAAVNLNDTLGMVFAGLRHELGNPVNSIKAALSLIRNPALPEERREFYLGRVAEQVERMEYLLEHMRSFGVFDRLQLEELAIEPLTRAVQSLAAAQIEAHQIRLDIDVAPGLTAWADSHALSQVLLGLISNAIGAVTSKPAERRRIRLNAREAPDRRVLIQVDDNGPGFPEGDRERIFAPFFTTRSGGTGLGLAIARRLVTQMGGTITAGASAGGGASFSIVLDRTWRGNA